MNTPNIKDSADAVRGIAEAIPIYDDLLKPAVQVVGKGLQTVAKTINIALAPISMLVWGYEKIQEYILPALEERLKNKPHDSIITPDPTIAGPALEALRFAGHKEDLRELYANLLASSMDSSTAVNAHPSFVEILKQLSPDEAKILKLFSSKANYPLIDVKAKRPTGGYNTYLRNFTLLADTANCSYPNLSCSYIENLARLGLAEIKNGEHLVNDDLYEPLRKHPIIITLVDFIKNAANQEVDYGKGIYVVTSLGYQFYNACISDKRMETVVQNKT